VGIVKSSQSSTDGKVTFDQWNQPVTLTAPKGALDFSKVRPDRRSGVARLEEAAFVGDGLLSRQPLLGVRRRADRVRVAGDQVERRLHLCRLAQRLP
jgi:hypothetical protein